MKRVRTFPMVLLLTGVLAVSLLAGCGSREAGDSSASYDTALSGERTADTDGPEEPAEGSSAEEAAAKEISARETSVEGTSEGETAEEVLREDEDPKTAAAEDTESPAGDTPKEGDAAGTDTTAWDDTEDTAEAEDLHHYLAPESEQVKALMQQIYEGRGKSRDRWFCAEEESGGRSLPCAFPEEVYGCVNRLVLDMDQDGTADRVITLDIAQGDILEVRMYGLEDDAFVLWARYMAGTVDPYTSLRLSIIYIDPRSKDGYLFWDMCSDNREDGTVTRTAWVSCLTEESSTSIYTPEDYAQQLSETVKRTSESRGPEDDETGVDQGSDQTSDQDPDQGSSGYHSASMEEFLANWKVPYAEYCDQYGEPGDDLFLGRICHAEAKVPDGTENPAGTENTDGQQDIKTAEYLRFSAEDSAELPGKRETAGMYTAAETAADASSDGLSEEMRTAYAKVIEELEKTYGTAKVRQNTQNYISYIDGLSLVMLIDLDSDGTKELLAVHHDPDGTDGYYSEFVTEVYTFADGRAEKIGEVKKVHHSGANDIVGLYALFTMIPEEGCFVTASEGYPPFCDADHHLWTKEGNSLVCIQSYVGYVLYGDNPDEAFVYENGEIPETKEEYRDKIGRRLDAITQFALSTNEYPFDMKYDLKIALNITKKTKALLGM